MVRDLNPNKDGLLWDYGNNTIFGYRPADPFKAVVQRYILYEVEPPGWETGDDIVRRADIERHIHRDDNTVEKVIIRTGEYDEMVEILKRIGDELINYERRITELIWNESTRRGVPFTMPPVEQTE